MEKVKLIVFARFAREFSACDLLYYVAYAVGLFSNKKMIVPEVTTLRRHLEAQHSVSLRKWRPLTSLSYISRQNTVLGPRLPISSLSYQVTSRSARRRGNR
jgi:hypothetical protein